MNRKIKLDVNINRVHYFIDDVYLGMLVFNKGELSDFRAIIRKNRLNIDKNDMYSVLRKSLFEILGTYLAEKEFYSSSDLQAEKKKIVGINDEYLRYTSAELIDAGV